MAAEKPAPVGSNYLGLLKVPKEELAAEDQRLVETLKASKVPSRQEAGRAALHSGDRGAYMRDARTLFEVHALYRIGKDVPEFASAGDFMWVVFAVVPPFGPAQVFYVSASTGKVLTVFP